MIRLWLAAAALAAVAGCSQSMDAGPAAEASNPSPNLLGAYLAVFEAEAADALPLADDASFYGALLPAPIVGRDEVRAFLNRVAPSVELLEVRQQFEGPDGACAELLFRFGELELEEAHCLKFEDGQIAAIRLYYDPRPLLSSD